jgi:YD repeat-containing protein
MQAFRSALLPSAALALTISGFSLYAWTSSGSDPIPGTEPISIGTPKRDKPLDYVSGSPTLTAGFQDWAICELGSRIETRPPLLGMHRWGPAALLGGGGGCGPCGGGGGSFSGDPRSAALGLQLFPPHDFPMGDIGALPPSPRDHAFVMAGTGEVVYQEVDFMIPGVGFDLVWTRTSRSAYDFEGWNGYGWSHCGENVLVEHANGNVSAYLWGRASDTYLWNSGTSTWTSPDGYWDQLTKGTRGSGYTPSTYANEPYFIKKDKTGVVWEFDRAVDTPKSVYVCTSITDPWGNSMEFLYNSTDPYQLDKVTDTEGREVTFTYSSGLMTQLTVSNSSIHADYGNVTIDYEYSGNLLTKATKHKTRQVDGGTVVRPYTEYSYVSGGVADKNLNLVKDCTVTVLDFDYTIYGSARDRCTQVTDPDGEVHTYTHENGSSPTYSRYTDPSGQYRDFEHADSANGDYFILKVKEYLENEIGNDLSGSYDLTITRDCDCGRITDLAYPDGSTEEWTYDANGNVTKYVRTSAGAEDDLVKAWTYDTFANHCRMLTSSGWLRQEATPSAKVTWAYVDGKLNTVTWPAITTPSSQTIQWEYEFNADGSLYWVDSPTDARVEYDYDGNDVLVIQDPADLALEHLTVKDVMGHATSSVDPSNNTVSTVTVAPDGRVLKVVGAEEEQSKFEYDLRGRRTKSSLLLVGTTWTHTVYTVSAGGVTTQTEADDGGLDATSTFAIEEGSSNRYTQSLDPDDYGTREQWGYGSYGQPWKTFVVDATDGVTTHLTSTLVRNTMGRVTKQNSLGGDETDFVYDGFGRLIETHTDLPESEVRKTIRTLTTWGAESSVEVEVDSSTLALTNFTFDQANRLYQTEQEDPEASLSALVTTYLRDAAGRVIERTDPRGSVWETVFDDVGRTITTVDPIGNEVQYAFDEDAQTRTITYNEFNTATSSFTDYVVLETMDDSGRVISSKNEGSAAGNRTTGFGYDLAGRRTSTTTPLGWTTTYAFDALGRLTSTTEPIGASTNAVTTYGYSLGGRRTLVTDANGIETEWTYDAFGRELSVSYDANETGEKTTTRTYDSHGRLDTITETEGNVQTMVYDDGGRRIRVDLTPDTEENFVGPDRVVFTFDDMDRVLTGKTQASAGGGSYTDLTSVTRTYDGFGRMESETQDGGLALAYLHDEGGAVKEITYPSGSVIVGMKYTLDDLGRPTTIERKLSTAVEGISTSAWETAATVKYHGHREVERVQAQYDLKRTQTWTSFKEPDTLEYKKNSSPYTLLTGLSSMWNADGQMVVRERLHDDAGGSDYGEVFRYDRMGRLTTMWYATRNPRSFATGDGPVEPTDPSGLKRSWDIGPVYERDGVKTKVFGQNPAALAYTVNTHYQVTAGPASMSWNGNGYLIARGADDFAWTALGQLAQADIDGGDTLDYTYDAFGRRVKTVNGSQVNRFLYHGWHMIGEWDDTADEWLWQEAPWSHGERMLEHIALDAGDVDTDENVNEYRQYAVHEDFQSTVWGLSGTNAAIAERYNYTDPSGQSESEDGAANALGDFATQTFHRKRLHGGFVELDSELCDFRNRWLMTDSGAWCKRDPLLEDSSNLYQFAKHNPLRTRDVNGLSSDGCVLSGLVQARCPAKKVVAEFCGQAENQDLNGDGSAGDGEVLDAVRRLLCGAMRVECVCNDCYNSLSQPNRGGETLGAGQSASWGSQAVHGPAIILFYYNQSRELRFSIPSMFGEPGSPSRDLSIRYQVCCPCGGTDGQKGTIMHELLHYMCTAGGGSNCGHDGGITDDDYDAVADKLVQCVETGSNCADAETAVRDLATRWN